jgi:hypothetical protein
MPLGTWSSARSPAGTTSRSVREAYQSKEINMIIIIHDAAITYFAVQLIGVSAADVSSMILVEVFQFVVDVQRS